MGFNSVFKGLILKVKLKVILEQAEGSDIEQRYSPTLSLTSALDGVGGQRHVPAAVSPGKTRYPSFKRLGGSRAGLDGYGKSRHRWDSIPGPPSLVARRYTD